MELYKIRNPEGKFSNGGISLTFSKKGKIWKDAGDLRKHLMLIRSKDKLYKYNDCEILVFSVTDSYSLNPNNYLKRTENEDNEGKRSEEGNQEGREESSEASIQGTEE